MKYIISTTLIIIIALFLTLGTGCSKLVRIDGNGSVVTETRYSVSFNYVENQGSFDVYIIQDTISFVEIQAESNLIPHIRTIVHGNTLEIDTRENLGNNYSMNVIVHTPVIDGVALSGSGLIDVDNIETGTFEAVLSGSGVIYGDVSSVNFYTSLSGSGEIDFFVDTDVSKAIISGSGDIKLNGISNYADYKISGSGNIDAFGLPVNECTAKISGSGNIYTTVSDLLNITISGSGNLYYRGDPSINSNISGSGLIISQ